MKWAETKQNILSGFLKLLYNAFILPTYFLMIHLLGLFNKKINLSIQARKGVLQRWQTQVAKHSESTGTAAQSVWIHVSSVGEFLQAKPLMSALKKKYPGIVIWLSLYSESGMTWINKKKETSPIINSNDLEEDWAGVDYLPWDSRFVMDQMLKILNPRLIIFVKFDLWPNLIWRAHLKKIPMALVSATLSEKSKRTAVGPVRALYRDLYRKLNVIAAVSEEDAGRFMQTVPEHKGISVSGDTRAESVISRQITAAAQPLQVLASYLAKNFSQMVIVGSSWPEDEQRVLAGWNLVLNRAQFPMNQSSSSARPLLVIVPHEPKPQHLQKLTAEIIQCSFDAQLWTDLQKCSPLLWDEKLSKRSEQRPLVLIYDVTGGLAELYRIGTAAYVGSGRGGVHNTLEPAAWSLPILFGPRYHNAPEAIALLAQKAAFSVSSPQEFAAKIIKCFDQPQWAAETGKHAHNILLQSQGAAAKCLDKINNLL